MINPQWLELPMSRTIFYGPKDVRAIEVRLYLLIFKFQLFGFWLKNFGVVWDVLMRIFLFFIFSCVCVCWGGGGGVGWGVGG